MPPFHPEPAPTPPPASRPAGRAGGWVRWAPLCVAAAAAGACRPAADLRPDDVRHYTVPREQRAAAPAPQRGQPAPGGVAGIGLEYDLPPGWVDQGPSGMRLTTLRTGPGAGDDVGEVTVIPAAGTLESNAARWQEQLMPGGDAGRVSRAIAEAAKVSVNGVEATILVLEDDATENRQAILGAMIPVEASTALFVKFKGPAAVAAAIREPFTTFVRSIRWKAPPSSRQD